MTKKLSVDAIDKLSLSLDFGRAVLEKIVKDHEAAQAALDARAHELRPEVLQHFKAEARANYGKKAEDIFEKYITPKRNLPAEQRALIDPAALRRTARLHTDDATDALMTSAFLSRLAIASPRRLAEMAKDIAEKGDFAKADLLEDFVASRGDALGNDIIGAVETALGPMAYNGPEVEQLNELESLIFEAEQTVSLVKTGARKYTAAQFEAMDQAEFEAARRAQQAAGIEQ